MKKFSSIDVPTRCCNGLQRILLIIGTIILTFLSVAVLAGNDVSFEDEYNEQNSYNQTESVINYDGSN